MQSLNYVIVIVIFTVLLFSSPHPPSFSRTITTTLIPSPFPKECIPENRVAPLNCSPYLSRTITTTLIPSPFPQECIPEPKVPLKNVGPVSKSVIVPSTLKRCFLVDSDHTSPIISSFVLVFKLKLTIH